MRWDKMRGDRLRALREASGITQLQLAEAVGSSEPQIFRYEKNKNEPGAGVLVRLAQYFNVSADYLLGLPGSGLNDRGCQLSDKEIAVIAAWRRGAVLEAIRIMSESDKQQS